MNFIAVIKNGLEALKVGKSLLHVEAWKSAQAISSLLVAVVAVIRACGVDFRIDDSTLAAIGVAIAAIVNSYLTYATSKKVGLAVETPPNIEPVETPSPAKAANPAPTERRTHHHETVRNPQVPPATVGAIRKRNGERLSDGPTDGVERRGVSDMEYPSGTKDAPFVARSDDAGWNDR